MNCRVIGRKPSCTACIFGICPRLVAAPAAWMRYLKRFDWGSKDGHANDLRTASCTKLHWYSWDSVLSAVMSLLGFNQMDSMFSKVQI